MEEEVRAVAEAIRAVAVRAVALAEVAEARARRVGGGAVERQ